MGAGDDFSCHEGSKHSVASGFVWQDDMTGLFPSDGDIVSTHSFGDIRITDGGNFGVDFGFLGPIEETLVGHDGDSNRI